MRAAAMLLLCSTVAAAEPHGHPPEHAGLHDRFYSTWMRPDDRSRSCCNKHDCFPSEAKFIAGQWQARDKFGIWRHVPATRVERERESPDGRNHVCISPAGMVWCFLPGVGM